LVTRRTRPARYGITILETRYTRIAGIFAAVSDCDLAVSAGKTDVADTGIVVHKINTCPCIKKAKKKNKKQYIDTDNTTKMFRGLRPSFI